MAENEQKKITRTTRTSGVVMVNGEGVPMKIYGREVRAKEDCDLLNEAAGEEKYKLLTLPYVP